MQTTAGPDVQFGLSSSEIADLHHHAQTIEKLGFDYLAVGEHVSFHTPVPNSFISLAYAAAATSEVRLISTIAQLPLYPAALVAKMSASLDVASGGRFELGIGVAGENPREFDACGVPLEERGARADEALRMIRELWSGRPVSHNGRFATYQDITISPPPAQPGGPPIWVSGRKRAAQRRAAMLADGWLPYMYSPEMIRESLEQIGEYRRLSPSPSAPMRCAALLFTACHEDSSTARDYALQHLGRQYAQDFAKVASSYLIVGNPDECRARVEEFASAGCDLIIFASACPPAYRSTNEQLLAKSVLALEAR